MRPSAALSSTHTFRYSRRSSSDAPEWASWKPPSPRTAPRTEIGPAPPSTTIRLRIEKTPWARAAECAGWSERTWRQTTEPTAAGMARSTIRPSWPMSW